MNGWSRRMSCSMTFAPLTKGAALARTRTARPALQLADPCFDERDGQMDFAKQIRAQAILLPTTRIRLPTLMAPSSATVPLTVKRNRLWAHIRFLRATAAAAAAGAKPGRAGALVSAARNRNRTPRRHSQKTKLSSVGGRGGGRTKGAPVWDRSATVGFVISLGNILSAPNRCCCRYDLAAGTT